ncbi:UDP-N-acetylglucosamine--N-acetylmuramyl-(pentapeptide) pyrophosphoryl-undecaprenol N-acetylglucosamine transferase [Piscirickettsia litoralis]|uniref:UDP-N-acetylglucosamine--N-acetylmuramyl- (pentapeptide) pyrophosphoryl-undecaprenol N-acetylglucosamine transferase n=1 Tax=Piscirickettsia litoralis TaxID=1891921 RepID=UPI000A9BD653|nr:glycosyltransferase [Piscirickettsia litoralis]
MDRNNAPMVLMMAGGTGGHVFPALETAKVLQERGYAVQWLGTATRIEADIVPEAGIKLHCLHVRGIRGKGVLGKLKGIFGLLLATWQALRLMKKTKARFSCWYGRFCRWTWRVSCLVTSSAIVDS